MSLRKLFNLLKQEFKIEDKYLFLNDKKNRIEIAIWILEKISLELKNRVLEFYMIE